MGLWIHKWVTRDIEAKGFISKGHRKPLKAMRGLRKALLKVGFVMKSESISCLVMSDSATPWIVARQAPLSLEFSRQEYWSGLPFPSRGSSWPRNQTRVSCIAGRWFEDIVFSREAEIMWNGPHLLQATNPDTNRCTVSAPHLSPFPRDPGMPFLIFDLGNAPAPWGADIYGQAGASSLPPTGANPRADWLPGTSTAGFLVAKCWTFNRCIRGAFVQKIKSA